MDPIEPLREICLALPEVSERLSHGEPAWFVRSRKSFVMYADHHHDDRVAFWCAAPPGVQEEMVSAEPDRFFRPPYVGHRGRGAGHCPGGLPDGGAEVTGRPAGGLTSGPRPRPARRTGAHRARRRR